jgi:pimeloyl-ACP methyl ester carboxylesterase
MNCSVAKGSIHYQVVGEGFPILFLHAMGTDHRSMKAWSEPVFSRINGIQRIYIDLPAHGRSLITDDFHSSDDMLLNILDFVDQTLFNQDFSVIGSSYGGYIAQGILHHRRANVKSIALLAPAIHQKKRTLPNKVTIKVEDLSLHMLSPDVKHAFKTLMTYQSIENLERFIEEIQPGRELANREFLTSNWREHGYYLESDPFCDAETLSQPALILLGKQDSICGYKDHFFLVDKFPHSTFVILDQAGHMLQIEQREIVQELVKEWVQRTLPKVEE